MKILFLFLVIIACALLIASMVFIDGGVINYSALCALGGLVNLFIAYQIKARYFELY